ncbi:Sodium/calcium exchanger NCL2 [Dirofilaria immitis]
MLKSKSETKINVQKGANESKSTEVFEQTSENIASVNVEFDPDKTTNKSRYSRRKHSYHALSSSLRSGKFWLRIFRPWKWRKRHHRERLRRVTSDHMQENSPPAIIRPSFSTLESLFSVPDVDVMNHIMLFMVLKLNDSLQ